MLEQIDEGDQDEVEVGGSMIYQCSLPFTVGTEIEKALPCLRWKGVGQSTTHCQPRSDFFESTLHLMKIQQSSIDIRQQLRQKPYHVNAIHTAAVCKGADGLVKETREKASSWATQPDSQRAAQRGTV